MERGRITRPPIPYIPLVDPFQDVAEGKTSNKKFKVTLNDGTTAYHAVYDGSLNKVFIIHVQEVLNFCKNKGFFKAYEKSRLHLLDCITRSTNAKDKLTDAKDDKNTSEDRMKALEKSEELARTAVLLAGKALSKRGKQFFSLYEMLQGEMPELSGSKLWLPKLEQQTGLISRVMYRKLLGSIP